MTPLEIKSLRLKLGESQAKFCQRFGGRQATVSNWETGRRKPSVLAEKVLREIKKQVEAN